MLASGTSAAASASSATATGWPWKFPPESTSSSSGSTIGLSETAFASTSRTPRTNRSTSRVAPFTCGEHRSEYASCTRCVLSRCDATIGLPSSSRRRFDAEATTPGCGRSAVSRSSKTRSEPSAASTLIAAVTSAVRTSRSARATARIPIASMPCVPLTSASPSLALSSSGSSPAERRTSPAGRAVAVHEQLAAADEREREVRERRQVARRAERSLLGHDGDQVAVQHLDHPLDDLGAHARVPEREHVRAEQQHRARLLARERRSDGGRVRADDPELERVGLVGFDALVRERAEPGRHAVDGLVGRDGAFDHVARGADPARRGRTELDLGAEGHLDDVLERERLPDPDRHGARLRRAPIGGKRRPGRTLGARCRARGTISSRARRRSAPRPRRAIPARSIGRRAGSPSSSEEPPSAVPAAARGSCSRAGSRSATGAPGAACGSSARRAGSSAR